jgi:GntR family negative regulator for fad regulon and positive regulator of fabA
MFTGQTTYQSSDHLNLTASTRITPPLRPAEHAESALITLMLDGTYPAGSTLPAERELAHLIGVTRPTLREALQRLARDGWLSIQQGKPTRVNDYWRDGGLNVLSALVRSERNLPEDFIPNLLRVRLVLAPAYAEGAVQNDPQAVITFLEGALDLPDLAAVYASFDWQLHRTLTIASGNPVFTLILNGFAGFYEQMAQRYFTDPPARESSQAFYVNLLSAARNGSGEQAARVTRQVMQESLDRWLAHHKGAQDA